MYFSFLLPLILWKQNQYFYKLASLFVFFLLGSGTLPQRRGQSSFVCFFLGLQGSDGCLSCKSEKSKGTFNLQWPSRSSKLPRISHRACSQAISLTSGMLRRCIITSHGLHTEIAVLGSHIQLSGF